MSNRKEEARDREIDVLFNENKSRLEQLAYRSVVELGNDPNSVVVLCIDVDDPAWTELVDFLMPGYDWQQFRDMGQKPVARGWKPAEPMINIIGTAVPAIQDALNIVNVGGEVNAIVMAAGGASVYTVTPKTHARLA